ncbi:hypothetical protein [Streptomyces sp. NPDC058964]|uniref:hypothetical protein n=1 Tax=Streptomyces sp. NPDC058964 TaxID=3346681 RepID=UPI00369F96BB
MKRPGPLLTLLAGLLLGLFMLTLNATNGTKNAASTRKEPPATRPTAAVKSPTPTASRLPTADASYAGRTDDDSSSVAVTIRRGRAIAYFCDGHRKESWLKGDVEGDGSMRLTGRDGAELDGRIQEGERIRGTVGIDGGHYAFTAAKAVKPSGLYRATASVRGAKVDGGWIVLPDGRQVGILSRDGKAGPAPRIEPATGAVTVDGERLTARPVTP